MKTKLNKTEKLILEQQGQAELEIYQEKTKLKEKLNLLADIWTHYLPHNIPHIHAQLDLITALTKPTFWEE